MHPKQYKGNRIVCAKTPAIFTLVRGKIFEDGVTTVFDELDNAYDWSECVPLIELLNQIPTVNDYQNLIDRHGFEFASQIWCEFETHYPVETAIVAIKLYCDNWQDFCNITDGYGVSKEHSPELNQKFRDRLKEKGLERMVSNWYVTRTVA